MSKWCKFATDFLSNPAIAEAGEGGAIVYAGLILLHARKGARGIIPSKHSTNAALRMHMPALGLDEAAMRTRCGHIADAGLITVNDDGSITISGWDDKWAPKCRCGKPNQEPSYATCENCRHVAATSRTRRGHIADAASPLERVEESRVDKREEREAARPRPVSVLSNSDSVSVPDSDQILKALEEGGFNIGKSPKQIAASRRLAISFLRDGGDLEQVEALVLIASQKEKPGSYLHWALSGGEDRWRSVLGNDDQMGATA